MKKLISIVTPCCNEEENIAEVYQIVKNIFARLPNYSYEHIFIDNASTDRTIEILRNIASIDKNLKVIVNINNFGHIRSPYYAILQSEGDAVIIFASNLKDPPELIFEFLRKWEEGHKVIIGIKNKSKENPIMHLIRKTYYEIIDRISETKHIKNFIGFGLYDKSFVDILKTFIDPYPYFRGLVAEYASDLIQIPYTQLKRSKGKSKNNFFTLYDMAMLGFVNHSKIPIRLASFLGFSVATASLLIAFLFLIFKLMYWDFFPMGYIPLIISLFFLGAVQLFFIGILGEYILATYIHVKNRPLVIERERINFN